MFENVANVESPEIAIIGRRPAEWTGSCLYTNVYVSKMVITEPRLPVIGQRRLGQSQRRSCLGHSGGLRFDAHNAGRRRSGLTGRAWKRVARRSLGLWPASPAG